MDLALQFEGVGPAMDGHLFAHALREVLNVLGMRAG
jgi:hypothetical protein